MKWFKTRQRYGKWRDVELSWYDGPQGPELLAAHVAEVVQSLMRDVAVTGRPIILESFRVTVLEDYGDFTIEAGINTTSRRRDA